MSIYNSNMGDPDVFDDGFEIVYYPTFILPR